MRSHSPPCPGPGVPRRALRPHRTLKILKIQSSRFDRCAFSLASRSSPTFATLSAQSVISLRCNDKSAFGTKRTWLDLLMARPGRAELAGHSAFAPANLTTLAHFSASSGRPYRSCSPSTARSLNTDYQLLDLLVVAGFCFRFSDYHKPSAVELAVGEDGKTGRPAHNSFALVRYGAGRPSSA